LAAQVLQNGALVPLERHVQGVLPDDLPHVHKYKGMTNADFTLMMLHCAKAASAFARTQQALRVMDPMCGKATTLFCAMCEGNEAVGVETDIKSIQEAASYYERFLKFHKIKHKRSEASRTLAAGGSARCFSFEAAQDTQAMKDGRKIKLEMIHGDAARTREMVKANSVHLIVSDLPYGVQHAPKENGGMSSLGRLLSRVAPGCVHALKPGGAAAFAFNLNTLRRKDVEQALADAGMEVLTEGPYADFSHWVEQAVDRDVVIARKPLNK
jgi:tRNA G10  N-methylase Trm11